MSKPTSKVKATESKPVITGPTGYSGPRCSPGPEPSEVAFAMKSAVTNAVKILRDRIIKVAGLSCQGSKLDRVTEVTVGLKVIPSVQIKFRDVQGHNSSIILEPNLLQDGNQSSYPEEAGLYVEAVKGILTSIPNITEWQTIKVDINKS